MPESRHSYENDQNCEKFCKLFIGGLNYSTNEETMKAYFEQWGEVVDCVVMREPSQKKSRGFGFITYKTAEQVNELQRHRPHKIDNKEVETKRAMPRSESDSQTSVKKLFVGGISENTTEEDIRNYFGSYGAIESVDMITDKNTGKKRGFCFINFEDYDTVDQLVLIKYFDFNAKRVEVKKALSRAEMKSGGASGGGGGGGGGGGPGRGRGMPGGRGSGGGDWSQSPGNFGGYGSNFGYGQGGFGGGGNGGYGGNSGGPGCYGGSGGGGYGQGGWGQGGGGGYNDGFGGNSGNWGNNNSFGSNYGENFGGGPLKRGGYPQRSGPYGGGGGSGGGGYGGGGSGGSSNYGSFRR